MTNNEAPSQALPTSVVPADRGLASLLQVLTERLTPFVRPPDYATFVRTTLELSNACLNGPTVDPDLLYSHLENLDEEDIFTYSEFDAETRPEVWACIESAVAYLCLLNYEQFGERYLPQSMDSMDVADVEYFFDNYRKCLDLLSPPESLWASVAADPRIDLSSPFVQWYSRSLLGYVEETHNGCDTSAD